jgi:uncharacterized membrane protein
MTNRQGSPARRAVRRVEQVQGTLERRNPIWPAQIALLLAILLGLALPRDLTVGPTWLFPVIESAVLLASMATTPRTPHEEEEPRRYLRIGLVALLSAVNVVGLLLLAQSLLQGAADEQSGRSLLTGGTVLWFTAVLLFGIWFWELDRGGPVHRMQDPDTPPDFLFPQMSEADWAPEDWRPRLGDYLYLSLTNAASFSPGETNPLSRTAKLLMSIQTLASLATMTIVLAYAVNNLG